MTIEKTHILVVIEHNGPLRKTIAADLPNKLEQAAYDFIMARGGDCGEVKAKQVEELRRSKIDTIKRQILDKAQPIEVRP